MFSCQKTFRKQTEKEVGTIKSLKFSSKKYELNQIESIFLQNLKNELIHDMLKEIVDSQDIIKTNNLRYKSKNRKVYNFSDYSLPNVFLRDKHEVNLSLKMLIISKAILLLKQRI